MPACKQRGKSSLLLEKQAPRDLDIESHLNMRRLKLWVRRKWLSGTVPAPLSPTPQELDLKPIFCTNCSSQHSSACISLASTIRLPCHRASCRLALRSRSRALRGSFPPRLEPRSRGYQREVQVRESLARHDDGSPERHDSTLRCSSSLLRLPATRRGIWTLAGVGVG